MTGTAQCSPVDALLSTRRPIIRSHRRGFAGDAVEICASGPAERDRAAPAVDTDRRSEARPAPDRWSVAGIWSVGGIACLRSQRPALPSRRLSTWPPGWSSDGWSSVSSRPHTWAPTLVGPYSRRGDRQVWFNALPRHTVLTRTSTARG